MNLPPDYFPLPIHVEPLENGKRWRLLSPFEFVEGDDVIHVPANFVTDMNSTPRIVWWWFPKTEFAQAGIVHDWLYRYPHGRTRQQCDEIHERILLLSGCRPSKAKAAYYGIRVGAGGTWDRYRAEDVALAQVKAALTKKARKRKGERS